VVSLSLLFVLFGCGSRVSWELFKSDCVPTEEVWYDGVDQDCDGNDDDKDGDGLGVDEDCWDDPDDGTFLAEAVGAGLSLTAAEVYPGAEDAWYDGVDQNCDGANDFDQDGDGFESANDERADGSVGEDCDDAVATTNPGVYSDSCWEGIDNDCDMAVDEGSIGASCYGVSGGELVISELFILGRATTDPRGEWFEVYNPHGTHTVYMESLTITRQHSTNGSVSFTIDEVIAVEPKDTAVFCYDSIYLGASCDFVYGGFARTGFELTQDASTTLIISTTAADIASRTLDSVNYNGTVGVGRAGTWPGVNAGYSYELKPDKLTAGENDDGTAWCETTGDAYHTPLHNSDHVVYRTQRVDIGGGAYLFYFNSDYGTPNAPNTCP
jgi:hypothetical protein